MLESDGVRYVVDAARDRQRRPSEGSGMSSKPRVMSELGSASGCVNRCLDILQGMRPRDMLQQDINELVERLQKADKAILFVAHTIERLEDDNDAGRVPRLS